jgi:hypothetical protein
MLVCIGVRCTVGCFDSGNKTREIPGLIQKGLSKLGEIHGNFPEGSVLPSNARVLQLLLDFRQ